MSAKIMESAYTKNSIHVVIKDEDKEEYHKVILTAELILKLIDRKDIFSIKRKDPDSPDLLPKIN